MRLRKPSRAIIWTEKGRNVNNNLTCFYCNYSEWVSGRTWNDFMSIIIFYHNIVLENKLTKEIVEEYQVVIRYTVRNLECNCFLIEKANKIFDKCHGSTDEQKMLILEKLKKWNFCHMAGILPYQHTLYLYMCVQNINVELRVEWKSTSSILVK